MRRNAGAGEENLLGRPPSTSSHPRSLTFELEPSGEGTRFTSRQEVRGEEAAFFGIDEELHRRAAARFINAFLETLKDLLEHPSHGYR